MVLLIVMFFGVKVDDGVMLRFCRWVVWVRLILV